MALDSTSLVKGLLLAFIIVIAGFSISNFFFYPTTQQDDFLLQPVDLHDWVSNETMVLPALLDHYSCCVNGTGTLSTFNNLKLYDNVSSFKIFSPNIFSITNWLMTSYSFDYIEDNSAIGRERNFNINSANLHKLSQEFKNFVKIVINSGINKSIETLESLDQIYLDSEDRYSYYQVNNEFYGEDGVVIRITLLSDYIILYSSYYKFRPKNPNLGSGYGIGPSSDVHTIYYLQTDTFQQGMNNTYFHAINEFLSIEINS